MFLRPIFRRGFERRPRQRSTPLCARRFSRLRSFDAIRDHSINVLVSNPPYVPRTDQPSLQREVRDFEPHVALFAGPTGLEIYEKLIAAAARVLRPHGWLLLELGYNSLDPVRAMLEQGWSDLDVIPIWRVFLVYWEPECLVELSAFICVYLWQIDWPK